MKNIFLLLATLTVFSCSPKKEVMNAVPTANEADGSATGPYTVAFDLTSLTYEHSFEVNIQQDSGKVEYFITTDRNESVVVENYSSSVSGCPVEQVKHVVGWFEIEAGPTTAVLKNQSKFQTKRKTKGKVVHLFENLNGCTKIAVTMKLRQLPHSGPVGKVCDKAADINECRVDVYCREMYSTNFVEIEVWNRKGQLTLNKFMNRGNGDRGLMSMNSARLATGETTTIYTSTSSSAASLKIQNSNLSGLYSERIMGQDFSNELICDL